MSGTSHDLTSVFLNICQLLNLVKPVLRSCAMISALAMNEQNCSEVSVYGGPCSLGGENQSKINTCSILSALRACTHGFDVRVTLNRVGWPSQLRQARAHTHTLTYTRSLLLKSFSVFSFQNLCLFSLFFLKFSLFLQVEVTLLTLVSLHSRQALSLSNFIGASVLVSTLKFSSNNISVWQGKS